MNWLNLPNKFYVYCARFLFNNAQLQLTERRRLAYVDLADLTLVRTVINEMFRTRSTGRKPDASTGHIR